jgi:hypothetical protein
MKIVINNWDVNILENDTDIYGLKFKPQLEDKYDNDADIAYFHMGGFVEVSDQNFQLMDSLAKKYSTYGIMEIGVSRNGDRSFTRALLNNKPDNVPYLGVDLDDKTYLNNVDKNIFTIKENSFNQESVRKYIKEIGMEKISILFIDGWHSVNAVINDWLYSDMLSENGIVVFHDTNYHPGPAVFLPAIDSELFRVEYCFENQADYGMAIAYKIK